MPPLLCSKCPHQNDGLISTVLAKEFIDDIFAMSIPALLFSGGEPLLREDIFELGYYAGQGREEIFGHLARRPCLLLDRRGDNEFIELKEEPECIYQPLSVRL